MTITIDPNYTADLIVANLRAAECDAKLAREILKLCESKIKKGDLHKRPSSVN